MMYGLYASSLIGKANIYLRRKLIEFVDFQEGSPTNRPPRNRLQALRDERCGLNGLRNIGNTVRTSLSRNIIFLINFYRCAH